MLEIGGASGGVCVRTHVLGGFGDMLHQKSSSN